MVCLGANFLNAAVVKNRAALIPASLDLSRWVCIPQMLPVALVLVHFTSPVKWSTETLRALYPIVWVREGYMYQTDLNMCSHTRSLLLVQVVLLGRGRGWWAPQFSTVIQGLGLASLFTRSMVTSKLAQSHHHSSQLGEHGGMCGRLWRPTLEKAHITSTQIP